MAIPSSRSRARRLAPPSIGAEPQSAPIHFGGSWLAGDASVIPDGYVRSLHNMLLRPGPRWDARPPFVYDGLMNVTGLALWEDLSRVTRFIAFDSSRNMYIKDVSGEGWSAGVATGLPSGSRLIAWTNYRSKLYAMFDDGSGTPKATLRYDGTSISLSPFNTPILAYCDASFGDRVFLAYPRITVTNLLLFNEGYLTAASGFVGDNAFFRLENVTAGSIVVSRFTPKSATQPWLSMGGGGSNGVGLLIFTLADSGRITTEAVVSVAMRNTSASTDAPMQVAVVPYLTWQPLTNNNLNMLVRPRTFNGFRYRVIARTTGTSGAVEPVWPLVPGATIVDSGVTWINDGLNDIASGDITLTPDGQWQAVYVPISVPKDVVATSLFGVDIRAGNTSTPTLTTFTPVDIALRDGLADGNPSKRNYGAQVTYGDYYFPFFNRESSQTATVDLDQIVWSETSEPGRIRAANNYQPKEVAGYSTMLVVVGGRLVMFKRRAFWTFKLTDDPDNPILPETPATVGIGGLGPLGFDVFDGELFWIGEDECYRMRVGSDPTPFCGDAMREEIMAKGANWVEFQTTPANQPLLTIDRKNRDIYVKTQKGKLYCYHLGFGEQAGGWATVDTVSGADVTAMLYNPSTNRMYFAFSGSGLSRAGITPGQFDTTDNTATPHSVIAEITTRPFELFSEARYELALHELGLFHLATIQRSDEDTFCYVSFDRGATFTKYIDVRLDPSVPRTPFPIFQSGVSITPKFAHIGTAGASSFSVSRADALIELLSGEWPFAQPTQVGGAL